MGPWLVEVKSREEMIPWLGVDSSDGAQSIRLIVRGDDARVREFLPNALDAAKSDPRRVVIWARDASLLTDAESGALFNGSPDILGSVVFQGKARGWVYRDAIGVANALFALDSI